MSKPRSTPLKLSRLSLPQEFESAMNEKDPAKKKNPDKEKREDDVNSDEKSKLKPVRPKIGEHKDNLKQRSDWFQKRTGKQRAKS